MCTLLSHPRAIALLPRSQRSFVARHHPLSRPASENCPRIPMRRSVNLQRRTERVQSPPALMSKSMGCHWDERPQRERETTADRRRQVPTASRASVTFDYPASRAGTGAERPRTVFSPPLTHVMAHVADLSRGFFGSGLWSALFSSTKVQALATPAAAQILCVISWKWSGSPFSDRLTLRVCIVVTVHVGRSFRERLGTISPVRERGSKSRSPGEQADDTDDFCAAIPTPHKRGPWVRERRDITPGERPADSYLTASRRSHRCARTWQEWQRSKG